MVNILTRCPMLIFKIFFFFSLAVLKVSNQMIETYHKLFLVSQTKIFFFLSRHLQFFVDFSKKFSFFFFYIFVTRILFSLLYPRNPDMPRCNHFDKRSIRKRSDSGCWSRSASVSSSWPHLCSFYFFFFSFFFADAICTTAQASRARAAQDVGVITN